MNSKGQKRVISKIFLKKPSAFVGFVCDQSFSMDPAGSLPIVVLEELF